LHPNTRYYNCHKKVSFVDHNLKVLFANEILNFLK